MASKAPKPTIRERAAERICPNCGKEVARRPAGTKGNQGIFCPPLPGEKRSACNVEHQNRRVREGAAMAALIKAWRIDRGQGPIAQESFSQICQIADQFNADDLAAGRPRADLYAAKLLADGSNFFDRQRR